MSIYNDDGMCKKYSKCFKKKLINIFTYSALIKPDLAQAAQLGFHVFNFSYDDQYD